MASADHKAKIDANVLEAIAKARPDDMFLKGSGVLKLIDAIRNLERENRELLASAAQPPRAPVATEAPKLPAWWDNFILNVCEIPDRNSPEGEPDAMIATAAELEGCALNAMEGFPATPVPAVGANIEVTDAMVAAYLKANDAYWKRTDALPGKADKWRNGTPTEATRESLIAALAAVGASVHPAAWVSPEQFAAHPDGGEDRSGRYLPMRKSMGGKFTMPIFTAPVRPLTICPEGGPDRVIWSTALDDRFATKGDEVKP